VAEELENLTTLDNVKALLQEEREDRDELIGNILIPAASEAIRHETKRLFTIADPLPAETREFLVWKDRIVYLDESVTISSVVDEEDLTIEYRLLPESRYPRKGQYLRLSEPIDPRTLPEQHSDFFTVNLKGPYKSAYFQQYPMTIKVTGTWGYLEVPKEIDFQTARAVSLWYKGGIAQYTQAFAQGGAPAVIGLMPDRLPPEVMPALRAWKAPRGIRR
jgi:hypothetical protein